jgi:hypothetical protein
MENQNKRNKISTSQLHYEKRTMSNSLLQQDRNSYNYMQQIFGYAHGQQTLLERPYKKEKKTNGSESNAPILVNWEKVQIVVGEQTFNIQNHHQANLDLWHRALGMC